MLRDSSGNPLDPAFSSAFFPGLVPVTERSIFVDHGPIAKAPLLIQSGATATVIDATTVDLGLAPIPTVVGLSLVLSGTTVNGGTYRIIAVTQTRVRIAASLSLPDPANRHILWQIVDPRDGQIADESSDVVVRYAGVPVPAEAVLGLLGQIVMPVAPTASDKPVTVDYHWVPNPTVDFRSLNSKEFRFNNWNRDLGRPIGVGGHRYRYNNILVQPGTYPYASLPQPLQRDLKYRAYERAYTAVLNDPNLLLFNSPTNKIAFPPLSRTISSEFINYQASALPDAYPTYPWERHGSGLASLNNNELVLQATGDVLFWTRPIDLTFLNVFAVAWRMLVPSTPTIQGVYTGLSLGYSDNERVAVLGYLEDGGERKIGFLKAGAGNDPSVLTSWGGGLDGTGNPTLQPIPFDWSILHSYRLYQDQNGTIRLYLDGSVVESLRVTKDDLPLLSELNDPFNSLQGVFFGSLAREVDTTSNWDFVRYTILPVNPLQSTPAIFVSYEGSILPEEEPQFWTPVGFHGTETIVGGSSLVLDSTSASTLSPEASGLIDGDFRGFTRIEPLLGAASDVVLDVNVSLRTFTHGITPNAVMAAVDDGSLLAQLCWFSDSSAPKVSYGGRVPPEQFPPYTWLPFGTAPAAMVGQFLRITDSSVADGRVYAADDNPPPGDPTRVVSAFNDYALEFRAKVNTYTPDAAGFVGVMAHVYDSSRSLGVLLLETGGSKYVAFHSDGALVPGGQFLFNWGDHQFHTYRLVKNTAGNLVTLFVDASLVGTIAYNAFASPPPSAIGVVSFGSATPASTQAISTVDWAYTNCWRVLTDVKTYMGLWRGRDSDTLLGYHLPLKTSGRGARVVGVALADTQADFLARGVVGGDKLIVDDGPNAGTYTIVHVVDATNLTVSPAFPFQPSEITYRIPAEVDWRTPHRYRMVRDPHGLIQVFFDALEEPLIRVGYNNLDLPPSAAGLPKIIAGGMPSITWGAFDPTNLSQSAWDFVRYGITRSQYEIPIVPHHQVLNQRNVIASYEHHTTSIAHPHTDFWSESEGIPPQNDPDLLRSPSLPAYTLLNERTPLVPSTQTFEVRRPTLVSVPLASFNSPSNVFNGQGFILNTSEQEIKLVVPNDVLYDSLQVIETTTGEPDLIAPFSDENQPRDFGVLALRGTTCMRYDGSVPPEQDVSPTPWEQISDDPAHVFATSLAGVLTYGTDSVGTRTLYQNRTSLPSSAGLRTQVRFRLKVLQDSSGGLGDTKIRFGFDSSDATMALALVTMANGQRYVQVVDLRTKEIVGGLPFDFGDGEFHTYRLVYDPAEAAIQISVDPPPGS